MLDVITIPRVTPPLPTNLPRRPLSISSFHLHPEALVTPFHLSADVRAPVGIILRFALICLSVRPSVCLSVCLFDTRHAYAIFVVGLIAIYFASPATAASAVGWQR